MSFAVSTAHYPDPKGRVFFNIRSKFKTAKTEIIKENFEKLAYKREVSFGKFLGLFRVALIGKLAGADLFETMKLVGKEAVLKRLLNLSNLIS